MYEMNCKIRWELRSADSRILQSKTQDICVDALSVKWLDKVIFENLDPETQHLHFTLEIDGKTVSENSVLFCVAKYHRFVNPNLRWEIQGDTILVKSDAYAKAV